MQDTNFSFPTENGSIERKNTKLLAEVLEKLPKPKILLSIISLMAILTKKQNQP
jgi:hypothetical protein